MKRIQPYFYIVFMAGIFVLAGLILLGIRLFLTAESNGVTVDPQTHGEGEALYDLWFTSTGIYDLNVDHALNGILFSTENNTVSLLDRDRKLRWEKIFTTAPQQAIISTCGNYVVVGTNGGRLYFTSTDQQYWWANEGDPVDLIAISPNASWIVAARSQPDQDLYHLDLFNQAGELQWSTATGPINKLYLSSEYLEQANIYYTAIEEGQPVIYALNLEGDVIWSYEGQALAAVSKHGSRLAAVQGNRLIVYDSLGYELWNTFLPFEPSTVMFNPQNYNRILLYGSREGALENLYYFDLAEDLLWASSIADGSLFSFTADGQHIVTSSWRHYKEDYTQMVLLDRNGIELNSWEVAMRVERLIVSGHPHLIVVCGEDGYIDLIDLKPLLSVNGADAPEVPIYSPVTTDLRADETKITLYFVNENAELIPVTRAVSLTDNPLRAALEELIRGPSRGSSLYRTIPDKDIYIEVDFKPESSSLFLDLSPELVQLNGSTQSIVALDSLLLTVSPFSDVKEIYLTVNKEPIEIFGDRPIPDQPFTPKRLERPIYIPILSGDRYYLLIQEGAEENAEATELEDLVGQVLRSFHSLLSVSSTLRLLDINVTSELTQINLSSSIQVIFPEEAEEKDRLLAALFLDAVFLTVFENSNSLRAEILVEGENWIPPVGYPSTNRFFRQPYFINPE